MKILAGKGLESVISQGNIRQYTAEDPRKIIQFIENKLRRAQTELEVSKKLLPELKSIFNKTEKPKVKFYEGLEGIKEVYEDTLTTKEPLVGYGVAESYFDVLPEYGMEYLKRRIEKGIHGRFIGPNTPKNQERAKNDKEELRETRLVPKDKLNIEIEINVYDNKVILASFEEELGIIIESEKIANAQKQIFELAWQAAEKYQTKRK